MLKTLTNVRVNNLNFKYYGHTEENYNTYI